jgi:NAD(P)H-dependent FMN reductase
VWQGKGDAVPKLGVIIASVREGRAGLPIAEWFLEVVRNHGGFEFTLIDLQVLGLPLLEEPKHPRLQQYGASKVKAWSALVASLDAFAIVTAEYNYGTPPALVNALDHLYVEWNYKAVGFVSYGGQSGGIRSVQMTKQILGAMKMVPLVEAVTIPFYTQHVETPSGRFKGSESHEKAARTMLDELVRWTGALASLRS